MIFARFDRWGNPLGTIKVLDADYQISTSGIDQLTLLTFDDLDKGERVVWKDPDTSEIHEHEVSETRRVHDSDGKPLTSATCINSICELYGDRYTSATDVPDGTETISNLGANIEAALTAANARWEFGGSGGYGTNISTESVTIDVDRDSIRSMIAKVVSAKSAELRTRVSQTDGVITDRTFYIYGTPAITDETATPKHRFTYKKNLPGVTREILSDEVYTAVKGVGAPILDEDGQETGQVLTCEVTASNDILNAWGRPGADGTRKHVWAYFQDGNCDNLTYLSAECSYYLDSISTPKVQYTCNIADIGNCDIGDYVDVIDKGFDPPIRIRARITEIHKNLLDTVHSGVITIGTPNYPMLQAYKKAEQAAKADTQSATAKTDSKLSKLDNQINSTSTTSPGLQKQINDINDWIDEHGSGGGNVGKFSWWDLQTDSFAFFDTACNFGITGKGTTIGCYQKQAGINPDPSAPRWLEGSEVWTALAATDATDSTAKAWLHVPNLAADKIVTSGSPNSSHCYIKQHNSGLYTTNGMRGVGLYYSGMTTKDSYGNPYPFIAFEPWYNDSGFVLKTPVATASGTSNGLSGQDVLSARASSSDSKTILCTPTASPNVSDSTTKAAQIVLSSSKGTMSGQVYQSGSIELRAGYYPYVSGTVGGRATQVLIYSGYYGGSTYRDGYMQIKHPDQSNGWKITTGGQILYNNRVVLDATSS